MDELKEFQNAAENAKREKIIEILKKGDPVNSGVYNMKQYTHLKHI